jgi:hypothetical protein
MYARFTGPIYILYHETGIHYTAAGAEESDGTEQMHADCSDSFELATDASTFILHTSIKN